MALAVLVTSLFAAMAGSPRLDAALVSRGICASRAQAKTAILAGEVLVKGVVVRKVSAACPADAEVICAARPPPYVSRAGAKLRAALDRFEVDAAGCASLDIGASTGGFTDCLLQAGASSVVALDNGHGQLDPALASRPDVSSIEDVNARYLRAEDLPRATYDLIVCDVSFISLTLVLPSLWPLLDAARPSARLLALVKPQFEAGRQAVAAGKGVVRDAQTRDEALRGVIDFAKGLPGCAVVGSMESPVVGGDGNVEYFVALAHGAHAPAAERGELAVEDGLPQAAVAPPRKATSAARAALRSNARRKARQAQEPQKSGPAAQGASDELGL